MASRLELHAKLVEVLGSSNVYFQPPSTIVLKYPCIIYKRDDQMLLFSNGQVYFEKKKYLVSVIDKNPDSPIPDRMLKLQYCNFNTHYVVDNLNHDVYSLYF